MEYCEIIGYQFAARIGYRLEQDLLLNRSVVHITGVQLRALWSGPIGNCWVTGSIAVNGTAAAELRLTNTESCGIYNMGETYAGGGEGTWGGFHSSDVTVEHLPDGSAEPAFRVDLHVMLTNGTSLDPGINGTVTVQLPRIPRTSQAAVTAAELGQPVQICISRAAERFLDTVRWTCGTEAGTIAEKSALTEFQWIPALTLANQAPDRQSVAVTITVTTFDGETEVGSREETALCPIPAWMVPSATVTVSDAMGYAPAHGGYIRTRSKARVETAAQGSYGSEITRIAVTCGGLSGSGADISFLLENSGSVPITVTVTDSRGRKTVEKTAVDVLPYERPAAVIRQAYRCGAQGDSQPDGEYLKLLFDAEATRVENGSVSYRAVRRVHGGTETGQTELTEYAGQFCVTGGSVVMPAGLDRSYACTIEVTDSFQTVSSPSAPVPVAFVLLDLSRSTKAVGIGMRAKTAGVLCIGLDADMGEHRIGNLQEPSAAADAATKNYVDAQIASLKAALGIS